MIARGAALVLVLCTLLLPACAVQANPSEPSAAAVHADVSPNIDRALRSGTFVHVGPYDLDRDLPLRRVLLHGRLISGAAGHWVFTARAMKQSRDCGFPDVGARCFVVARKRRTATLDTARDAGGAENGVSFTTKFRYAAVPMTQFGTQLAAAGVLVCADRPDHRVPWRGASTIAEGVFDESLDGGKLALPTILDADCPQTRLGDDRHWSHAIDTAK